MVIHQTYSARLLLDIDALPLGAHLAGLKQERHQT